MLESLITLDFETEAIEGNPILHPPRPVGLAVTYPSMKSEYMVGDQMEEFYKMVVRDSAVPILFHNAPFDLSVGRKWFDVPFPDWGRVHDTMYLIFLRDPHSNSLSLKPSAERFLGLPPEEQDHLKDWIISHIPEATERNWGAFICKAPVELVAPYAIGDTERTRLLFNELYQTEPHEPYDRERRLMPKLVAATRRGIRCNRAALEARLERCEQAQEQCENRIRAMLGVPGLNPHSGPELARALQASDLVRTDISWPQTPGGRDSTARDNLIKMVGDQELLDLLVYTGAMQTVMGTFMRSWLDKSYDDGRLHPNWNQVRQPKERERGAKGTRTGRLSSDNPNFQNVPNPFDFNVPPGLELIPNMREFILPEEGHVWLKRDWSGQEMRILAHHEQGQLAQQYLENPDLDPHGWVKELIYEAVQREFERRSVKETNFGVIYGMGAPGLTKKIGGDFTLAEGRALMDAHAIVLPGVKELQRITKARGRAGGYITTWGGRKYYAEEPKVVKNAYRSFEYKLVNYLIQGGAADQCKECICEWDDGKPHGDVFMATVHDEINISAPEETHRESMEWLRECMNADNFTVPMRSEPFFGPSWGELEEYEE